MTTPILSNETIRHSFPSFAASESIIVRMVHFTTLLTIVFPLEAGKRRLSMTSLYGASAVMRINLGEHPIVITAIVPRTNPLDPKQDPSYNQHVNENRT